MHYHLLFTFLGYFELNSNIWAFLFLIKKKISAIANICLAAHLRVYIINKMFFHVNDRFHAAVPVLDNRILISGGCSAIGALLDVHIFNLGEFWSFSLFKISLCFIKTKWNFFSDTCMWSSVASPQLSSKPCAGHSMVNLSSVISVQSEKHTHADNTNIKCTLLVFGGSDCSGSFYNDTLRCTVDITTSHIQATMGDLIWCEISVFFRLI